MAVNPHFPNYIQNTEQELLEDLVIEYIQQMGIDIYYLPRRRGNFNDIYYDDDMSYFDTFYPIEMYIKSYSGFGGDGTFASKFDIEIRDQIQFSIARRRFDLEIKSKEDFPAPREGDLIYFPFNKKLFQIMFSDNKPFFFQMGTLQMFDITCEVFEFASERFMTGIPEIDAMQEKHTQDVLEFAIMDADGNYIITGDDKYLINSKMGELIDQDASDTTGEFKEQDELDDIIRWDETNPYALRDRW